jgi:hypothetical protein
MKLLFSFLLSFIFVSFTFSQTYEEIMREAYPEEPVTQELTYFDILWKNMIEAKKKGNLETYEKASIQLKRQYPERFVGSQMESPVKAATQTEVDFLNSSFERSAETLLFSGNLVTYGTDTHIGGNPRTVRLRSAPDGTQYLSFGPATNDTFYIFRSTNAGSSWSLFTFGTMLDNTGRGLDFYITDTTGSYRIGVILSTQTPTEAGVLTFLSYRPDQSSPVLMNTFALPDVNRGLIHPAIVSDGYYYDPTLTYWYVAYQDYSASTPTANPVRAALTTDWGQTWVFTTVRSGFNDYDVDIEFRSHEAPGVDSVSVVLTNNLTLTNPNLRIRRVALTNFTGTFSQFNPANSSDPEFHSSLAVNRQTGEIICTFTRTQSGNNNIAYVYARPGAEYFNANNPIFIAQNAHQEGGLDVHCVEGQSIYRFAYIASGAADTIVYKFSFDLSTGVEGHFVVNENNNASNQIFPSVAGYTDPLLLLLGANDGSGIAFAGAGNTGLYYNRILDSSIPVELVSFNASVVNGNVQLSWSTASETNNSGFSVERRNVNNNTYTSWQNIAFVDGKGTTSQQTSYSYTDNNVNTGKYQYRLKQIDFNGTFSYSDVVNVDINVPQKFALEQNYPNPFNPTTSVKFSLPVESKVTIKIFNLIGQEVAEITNRNYDAGSHTVLIDGSLLTSGLYFYTINASGADGKDFTSTKKMLLMK